MLKRTALAPAVLALVLLTGACTQKSSSGGLDVATRNEVLDMKLSVKMEGDRAVQIAERKVSSTFVLIGEGGGEQLEPLLGVQPVEHIVEGNVRVLPGFALKDFKGKGTYTIEPGVPRDALANQGEGGQPKPGSSIRVEWWPLDGEPFEYVRRAKPCTVEVQSDDGTKGRLRCPDVTHEAPGGPHFSLELRWEKA